MPLAVAMCLNVILPNLSLAFSSVTFYQVARILLTPVVAVMNVVLYRATLPRNATIALIPACVGVGIVSYYDSLPLAGANIETTSSLGIVFAFTGVFASSLYTVWIGSYHTKLQMNSMQLLHNQAPIASLLLIYAIPYLDTFPEWAAVPVSSWLMILLVCHLFFVASDSSLTVTVGRACCIDQHIAVLHCVADWRCIQHSSWPLKDLYHCGPRLDNVRSCH